MKLLKDSQGLALFLVIMMMAVFLLIVTGGLIFSQLELKKTSNFKLAVQALETADAGLQHALAVISSGWNFNTNLNCGTPPCTVISQTSFPQGSDFSYTVTSKNDNPADSGGATSDTNNIIILNSTASGPNNTKKEVQAYVKRSLVSFTPPAAVYIKADSVSPAFTSYYFDNNVPANSIRIIGNDTNPNDLKLGADDTAGSKPSLLGIATTKSLVTNTLKNEYLYSYPGIPYHDILGVGSEPSINTVSDVLDVDTIASKFFDQASTVKYLNGLRTDSATCPSASPCYLGTSSFAPQITYIKDTLATDVTSLKGNVIGYGVLVLEGRSTIGENFKFNGLVVHKRSDATHYIDIQGNAWIYGGVLLGSYYEGPLPVGQKAKFNVRGHAWVIYSSQAITMVNNLCGTCVPQPVRLFAWMDK